MKPTPFLNALGASLYIVLVVFLINSLKTFADSEETILIPMFMLSLLVFSVAVMGFLFFYKPLGLYFENKKNEATVYFLKTLGTFFVFVVVFFLAMAYSLQ